MTVIHRWTANMGNRPGRSGVRLALNPNNMCYPRRNEALATATEIWQAEADLCFRCSVLQPKENGNHVKASLRQVLLKHGSEDNPKRLRARRLSYGREGQGSLVVTARALAMRMSFESFSFRMAFDMMTCTMPCIIRQTACVTFRASAHLERECLFG